MWAKEGVDRARLQSQSIDHTVCGSWNAWTYCLWIKQGVDHSVCRSCRVWITQCLDHAGCDSQFASCLRSYLIVLQFAFNPEYSSNLPSSL